MENNDNQIMERIEAATTLLERTLAVLEEHQRAGEVEKISATVEQTTRRESELQERFAAAENEIAELKAGGQSGLNPLRRTLPTSEMLAKHGIGEGPVDVRTLDAALAGLSLEQRIAVKSQLLRAGAIA